MDLRERDLSAEDLAQLQRFIIDRKLAYQPFIFRRDLEVGEGWRFHDGEEAGGTVYWPGGDPEVSDLFVKEEDLASFRRHNAELRRIYDYFLDTLTSQLGDISGLSFAEVGCNTGYFLHGLALRGAARTIGYDFTNNSKLFEWFNRVLGTRSEFHWAEWDSLGHKLQYAEVPEVDVALSVAVTCHLSDPLHHIAYLCDRSRKAVFLWCPVSAHEDLSISYGRPAKYLNSLSFPVCFDNEVCPSVPLLRLALEESGFGDIREVEPPAGLSPRWLEWYGSQKGYVAFRTGDKKTALSGAKARRPLPGDYPEALNGDGGRAEPFTRSIRGKLGRARRRLLGF